MNLSFRGGFITPMDERIFLICCHCSVEVGIPAVRFPSEQTREMGAVKFAHPLIEGDASKIVSETATSRDVHKNIK